MASCYQPNRIGPQFNCVEGTEMKKLFEKAVNNCQVRCQHFLNLDDPNESAAVDQPKLINMSDIFCLSLLLSLLVPSF